MPNNTTPTHSRATRSGFTSNKVALPDESASSYRALYRSYVAHFRPQNIIESDLVSVMAVTRWRLRRAVTIERNHLALEIDSRRDIIGRYVTDLTPDRGIAWTFDRIAAGNALPLLTRYEASLHRTFNNALKQLESMREKSADKISSRTQNLKKSTEPTPEF